MSEQSIAIEAASNILVEANQKISALLVHPETQMIALGITSKLGQLINQLNHLSGTAINVTERVEFGPVVYPEQKVVNITKEAFASLPDDIVKFKADVNNLYLQFDTLAPEGILNDYTIPEHQQLIRGVAKLAGVHNFEDATINLNFIEKVQKAIVAKRAGEAEQKRIDAELQKQDSIVETERRIKEVEEKLPQLQLDLEEAENKFNSASTPAQKKSAKTILDSVNEEIKLAGELHVKLTAELQTLTA